MIIKHRDHAIHMANQSHHHVQIEHFTHRAESRGRGSGVLTRRWSGSRCQTWPIRNQSQQCRTSAPPGTSGPAPTSQTAEKRKGKERNIHETRYYDVMHPTETGDTRSQYAESQKRMFSGFRSVCVSPSACRTANQIILLPAQNCGEHFMAVISCLPMCQISWSENGTKSLDS